MKKVTLNGNENGDILKDENKNQSLEEAEEKEEEQEEEER